MWLLFLQFDDFGRTVVMHVRCLRRDDVDTVLGMASQHGLVRTAYLTHYAVFSAASRIQPVIGVQVPYYDAPTFQQQWRAVAVSGRDQGDLP